MVAGRAPLLQVPAGGLRRAESGMPDPDRTPRRPAPERLPPLQGLGGGERRAPARAEARALREEEDGETSRMNDELTNAREELRPETIKAIILDFVEYVTREEGIMLCEENRGGQFPVMHTPY